MLTEVNKCLLYSTKKSKNDHYIREDTMTKIIATHICNISETFIGKNGHTVMIYRLLSPWP